jgi:tetraacyldisaccharide 4'-kinase
VRRFSITWLNIISGQQRGLPAALLRAVLAFVSLFYSLAIFLRNKGYDWGWFPAHRASVPVVVVGNLTVGGTGKTPAVEYLARFYRRHNRQVAILSRGYGNDTSRNDEALVLESNLDDVPHLQNPDRFALAQTAVEELESDLLVLDDGFQHRRLRRDLDLVLIDATQPWGYGWCLPRGLLREPRSALRRAGAVLITRSDQIDAERLQALVRQMRTYVPLAPIALARHAPQALHNTQAERAVASLSGQSVAALCGIGNPEGFLATLRSLHAAVIDQKIFPDHYRYQREDIRQLEDWSASLPPDTWLITTQKDWVKLQIDALAGRPLWSLRIALEITQGQEALEPALLQVIKPDSLMASRAAKSNHACREFLDPSLAQGCV